MTKNELVKKRNELKNELRMENKIEQIKQKLDDIKDLENLFKKVLDRPTYDDVELELVHSNLKNLSLSIEILKEELTLYLKDTLDGKIYK